MNLFRSPRSRLIGFRVALVGVAVSAFGLVATASALPAGTPPTNGLTGLTLSPASGDSGTTFDMRFTPSNQACPGNNTTGFGWSTFITPVAQDPALLTFSPQGQPVATAPGRTTAFRDTLDEFVRAEFPDLDTFIITEPRLLSFDTTFSRNPVVDPGSYYVGIACFNNNGFVTEKYWATRITVTTAPGAGPHGFTWATDADDTTSSTTSTTTTTTVEGGSTTTTTTVVGGTTTTVAGATTTTTVAGGAQTATLSPATPTPGGSYQVTHPDCRVGDTITVTQPQSTPTSLTATCAVPVGPQQAPTVGTATVTFTAAPTAPGTYTVTSSGPNSGTRTATFTITATTTNPGAATGGSPTSSSTGTGTIPSTGSSTTSLIVWGVLLLVFGRMAILLGRKPKVLTGT